MIKPKAAAVNLMRPDHEVFTQRNNALHPDETCWPTSVVQALHIRDIKMPTGRYAQPEDNLTDFCMKDARVQNYYKKMDPSRDYKPWQVHDVLCFAVNLWLGHDVAARKLFNGCVNLKQYLDVGRCVVLSGRFPYYSGRPISHAICVCGYNDEGYIICDPWGDYRTLYGDKSTCGREIVMTYSDFTMYMGTSCTVI